MSIHPRDILFYAGGAALERFGTASRRTASIGRRGEDVAETFARTGTALALSRGGYYVSSAANILRPHWIDTDDDGILDTCTLLLEDARTNLLARSSQFDADSTYWSNHANFTLISKTSVIIGQTAYEHEQDGGTNRDQTVGVFPAADTKQTVYLIVENVDAETTVIDVYDDTAAPGYETVTRGTLTWATGAFALSNTDANVTATAYVEKLLASGPNGGVVYLVAITWSHSGASSTGGYPGNTRSVLVYPSGTGSNSYSTILHHAQLEDDAASHSSPIVTGTSSATRNIEALSFPFYTPPKATSYYTRFVELGGIYVSSGDLLNVGATTGSRLELYPSSGYYKWFHGNGVSTVSSTLATAPSIGDMVELRCVFNSDGSVQLHQSINEAAETSASASAALAPASSFAAPILYIGMHAGAANVPAAVERVICVSGVSHSLADFRALLP